MTNNITGIDRFQKMREKLQSAQSEGWVQAPFIRWANVPKGGMLRATVKCIKKVKHGPVAYLKVLDCSWCNEEELALPLHTAAMSGLTEEYVGQTIMLLYDGQKKSKKSGHTYHAIIWEVEL